MLIKIVGLIVNILLIVDSLPPINKISSRRAYQLAKFFTVEGHIVHIVTSEKSTSSSQGGYARDLSAVCKSVTYLSRRFIFGCTKINDSKNNQKFVNIRPTETFHVLKSDNVFVSLLKTIKRHLVSFISVSDLYASKTNIDLVSKIVDVEKIDLLISSYSPSFVHKIASKVKNNHMSLFWIADFRDLWALNHNVALISFVRSLLVKYERKIIKNASLITSVSQGFIENLKSVHGQDRDYHLLTNGFDVTDLFYEIESVSPIVRSLFDDEVVISYTGSLYESNQNIQAMLEAINECSPDNIKFIFAGSELRSKVFCSNKNVFVFNNLSSNDCNFVLCNSDYLLVVDWDGEYSGVIPAKIFDYMAANKQIVLHQPKEKVSELKTLLFDAGFSISLSSVADWVTFIELLKSEGGASLYVESDVDVQAYERHAQVQNLIKEVEKKNV